jgi:hypothetical protein
MDPLMHMLAPSLILIAVGWKRDIIKWSFIALLPDFLYLTDFHRNLSHSFIVLGLVSALLYHVMRDKRLAIAFAFFLLSHPVLDLGGYVAVLYPLDTSYFRIHSDVIIRNPGRVLDFDIRLERIPPGQLSTVYDSYPLQTSTVLLWALLFSALIMLNRQKIIKGIRTVVRS